MSKTIKLHHLCPILSPIWNPGPILCLTLEHPATFCGQFNNLRFTGAGKGNRISFMLNDKNVSVLVVTNSPVLRRQISENLVGDHISIQFLDDKVLLHSQKDFSLVNAWIIDADFFKNDLLEQIFTIRKKYRRLPLFVVGAPVKIQNFDIGELNACGIDEYFERTDIWGNSSLILERLQYYARHGKKPRRRKLPRKHAGGFNVILIGASTGGPEVLEKLIYDLPSTTPPHCIGSAHRSEICRGFLPKNVFYFWT